MPEDQGRLLINIFRQISEHVVVCHPPPKVRSENSVRFLVIVEAGFLAWFCTKFPTRGNFKGAAPRILLLRYRTRTGRQAASTP
jgi:hypothetical protein